MGKLGLYKEETKLVILLTKRNLNSVNGKSMDFCKLFDSIFLKIFDFCTFDSMYEIVAVSMKRRFVSSSIVMETATISCIESTIRNVAEASRLD